MKTKLQIIILFFVINCNIYAQLTQAVDYTIIDTQNDTFQLFKLLDLGQFVLMDCGAMWCGACRVSIPALKNYWNKYHLNNGCLYILSFDIDQQETTNEIKDFITSYAIPYPVFAMDRNNNQLWNICKQFTASNYIPQFVLIKPDRTVPYMQIGSIEGNDANYLDSIIDSYVQNAVCYKLYADEIKLSNNEIKVIPSLFDNNLNIEFEINNSTDIQFAIYDNTGKEIKLCERKHLMKGIYNEQINTEFYKAGLYFFVININGQIQSRKIIKLQN